MANDSRLLQHWDAECRTSARGIDNVAHINASYAVRMRRLYLYTRAPIRPVQSCCVKEGSADCTVRLGLH